MYIDSAPTNLDPQVATSASEITSVLHLFSGLFRKMADGKVAADAAEDYSVSEDGILYTIKIKPDQYWEEYKADKKEITPVLTAHDFVFGIQRVFLSETKSPYTDTLAAIKNSTAVLTGQADVTALGVRAIDDFTLEITLSHPDPIFIERLCSPGAMPCNRDFFEHTNGAYGLSGKNLLTNGSFSLYSWQSGKGVGLSKINAAKGDINYVRMIVPSEKELKTTPLSRLESEITSGELVIGSRTNDDYHFKVFSTTTWAIVFNCTQSPFDTQQIRKALSLSTHNAPFLGSNTQLVTAQGIVPPSVTMLDKSYRAFAGSTLPSGTAIDIFRDGMNVAGLKALTNITVLVPDDAAYSSVFGEINQQWQKELSVFFSVSEMPQKDIIAAVEKGDFKIAIIPLTQSENDVMPVLSRYSKPNNINNFSNAEYNSLIKKIENTPQGLERANLYKQAEALLLDIAPIVPLFYEATTYLYPKSVNNLVINPYGPVIDATKATITS